MGALLVITSMLMFSIAYAFFKACGAVFPNTLSIFFVSLFSWLILLPSIIQKGASLLRTQKFPQIALRTLFGLLSLYCVTYALKTNGLAEVVLLNNTGPLFIPLIVYLFHRTHIVRQIWIGLIVGFFGIFLVLRPSFHAIDMGLVFSLASGLFSALLIVITRQIAHEPFLRLLFYYFFLLSIFLSPFLFTEWVLPPHWVWLFLFFASIGLLLAQLTLAAGMRRAPSHEVAPFLYTSVIFSGLIDWIFWHNIPNWISLLGMIIVCLGGLITMTKKRIT